MRHTIALIAAGTCGYCIGYYVMKNQVMEALLKIMIEESKKQSKLSKKKAEKQEEESE